jgi:hypothetical protein
VLEFASALALGALFGFGLWSVVNDWVALAYMVSVLLVSFAWFARIWRKHG